jgi:hypothetical protein
MLGYFFPRCPVDTHTKAWVERRMRWLASRFGIERLRNARVVLPTNEFFPDSYDGSEVAARDCFTRMCGYLGVDPASVTLEFVDDRQMPGAAGLYERRLRSNVCLARSQLGSPPSLLATLAHELAHELLLNGGHLRGDEADHEQVTDLLPVFFGAGIFPANATVQFDSHRTGNYYAWSISKQGYLNSITLGYALAVFAHVRGEDKPAWARHLRADARLPFRAGLRYLRRTGDTLFRPDESVPERPTTDDILDGLKHKSPSVRLSALWDLAERTPLTALFLPAVQQCLDDRDDAVQCEAVRLLGAFGPAAADLVPRLIEAAWYGQPDVRFAALDAIGRIRTNPGEAVPAVAKILKDEKPEMVTAAAETLAAYGAAAAVAESEILDALATAAAVTDLGPTIALVTALCAIGPNAEDKVRSHFGERDPEGREVVLKLIREQDSQQRTATVAGSVPLFRQTLMLCQIIGRWSGLLESHYRWLMKETRGITDDEKPGEPAAVGCEQGRISSIGRQVKHTGNVDSFPGL